ncbi:MAG: tol-pal system protein YbgF [Alphaproteobacteria bacterium]
MAVLVAMCAAVPHLAVAQDSDLAREIERLRRDVADLQRQAYSGGGAASGVGSEPMNADAATRLQLQMQTVQNQLRDLTGRLERMEFENRSNKERLERLSGDIDMRLRTLEQGGAGDMGMVPAPGASAGASVPASGASSPVPPAESPAQATGTPAGLAPGQRLMGTLTSGGSSTQTSAPAQQPPATAKTQQAALPKGDPNEQYQYAYGLLQQRDFEGAERSLQAFITANPTHQLTGNAMYWLGETYYIRKNYAEAARVFLDGYQKFPKGNKAPDNLLKLGMSLAAVGEKEPACQAYKRLVTTFPEGNQRIVGFAKSEITQLGCK